MNKKKHDPISITAISSSFNPYNSYASTSISCSKFEVSAVYTAYLRERISLIIDSISRCQVSDASGIGITLADSVSNGNAPPLRCLDSFVLILQKYDSLYYLLKMTHSS